MLRDAVVILRIVARSSEEGPNEERATPTGSCGSP